MAGISEEKKALLQWGNLMDSLAAEMPIEDWLTRKDIEKKKAELEADPIKWIKYFFPKYAKYDFAPFHVQAIHRIIEHDEWYEVLSWSRELAKSTVAMFIIMYLTMTKKKSFVILASATKESAIRLLTPYKTTFENNSRLIQFYGQQILLGHWTDNDFTTKIGARFVAIGAGSAPRGARNEAVRPDIIYMDDYDTDEDCRNPDTLKKKWEWFENALYPTRSISEPTLILWCGNIIAKDCCITRAGERAKHWDIVNIRDENGCSTWAAKNTEAKIDTVLSHISTRSQQAEYFNNPVAEGSIFKNIAYGECPPLEQFKFVVIYGDPAYSDSKKKGSSFKAVWVIGKLNGKYYILKGYLAHETNHNFIGWYYDLYDWVGGRCTAYCYMENNKLQDPFFSQVFMPLLREENTRRGRTLHIRGDERKKTDKATRIEANLEPLDRDGKLIFNKEEKDNPHMIELENQFRMFEMTMPYNADGCDAIEGGVTLIDEKTRCLEPMITVPYEELIELNEYTM